MRSTVRAVTGLRFTVSGPDIIALLRALAGWEFFAGVPETVVLDYGKDRAGTASWLETSLKATSSATVRWSEETRKALDFRPHATTDSAIGGRIPEYPVTIERVLADFSALPFDFATMVSTFSEWNVKYKPTTYGGQQGRFGWGCLFKGAGYDHLVSRRWLEYGPWVLHRGPNDTSLVQFHALDATLDEAIEQARPGHQRMGLSDTGGLIQPGYVYEFEPKGIYAAADRSLRILISQRDVSQLEMLDAAAYRHYHRAGDQPIASVRFIFVDGEERARRHLHELWLRDLECWAIVDGVEKRLDADYAPTPPPRPAWADR